MEYALVLLLSIVFEDHERASHLPPAQQLSLLLHGQAEEDSVHVFQLHPFPAFHEDLRKLFAGGVNFFGGFSSKPITGW